MLVALAAYRPSLGGAGLEALLPGPECHPSLRAKPLLAEVHWKLLPCRCLHWGEGASLGLWLSMRAS